MAIMYLIFAILSKLTAVFISIPYPVLGGCLLTIIGVYIGVSLSNLQVRLQLILRGQMKFSVKPHTINSGWSNGYNE